MPLGKTLSPKKAETAKPIGPATGSELLDRMNRLEVKLAEEARYDTGVLIRAVTAAGEDAGYRSDIRQWPSPSVTLGTEATKFFLAVPPANKNLA